MREPIRHISFKAFLCLVLTLLSTDGFSQAGLNVFGKMKVDKGSMDATNLTISKDGEPFKRGGVEKNGKFSFMLQFNSVYLFTFAKAGYVTKKILIDTHVPQGKETKKFNPFEFIVTVFEQNDSENKYSYSQPVARIHYSEFIDEFDYDTDYTKSLEARFKSEQENSKVGTKVTASKETNIQNTIKTEIKEEKKDPIKVINPRGATTTKKDIIPKQDSDKRAKVKAVADKDDRKVIRPGVAVDKKPRKETTQVNVDAKLAPYGEGFDPKPDPQISMYRHKTVNSYRELTMNITETIFTIEEDVIIYRKVEHDWGGVFYFKDEICVGKWVYQSEIAEYTEK